MGPTLYAPPAESLRAHLKGRLLATLKNKRLLLVVGAMAAGGLLQVIGEGRRGGAARRLRSSPFCGGREKAMKAFRPLSSLSLTAIALLRGKEGERPKSSSLAFLRWGLEYEGGNGEWTTVSRLRRRTGPPRQDGLSGVQRLCRVPRLCSSPGPAGAARHPRPRARAGGASRSASPARAARRRSPCPSPACRLGSRVASGSRGAALRALVPKRERGFFHRNGTSTRSSCSVMLKPSR